MSAHVDLTHIKFIFFGMIMMLILCTCTGKYCVEQGKCEKCHKKELEEDYCRETGMKIQIECRDQNSMSKEGLQASPKDLKSGISILKEQEYRRFKSCTQSQNDVLNVIIFQVCMAIIGGLAYWGVQKRRHNSMSQFDHRKLSGR
eukprot:gene9291-19281_t